MTPKDVFFDYLGEQFYPRLKREGFRGAQSTMRRLSGECIHIVNVEGWRYGGERCINVAVAFRFVPETDPKRVTEAQCDFGRRLGAAPGSDRWFQFGTTEEEARRAAQTMTDVYFSEAPDFFQRFGRFPDGYTSYTADCVVHRPLEELPPLRSRWRSIPRYALFFARMWLHLGDKSRAQEFAQLGLEHLGKATGLKDEFETMLLET